MRYDIPASSNASPQLTVPETFRTGLEQRIPGDGVIRFVAYTPEFVTAGSRWPASLLALGDERWWLLSTPAGTTIAEVSADYADTVLVERTSILLYGQLRIDYAAEGLTHAVTMEFDNVEERRYREGIERLVSSIEGVPAGPPQRDEVFAQLSAWPVKFRQAAADNLPGGHHIRSAVHWPAVTSGYRRELAPAAALLITDHEFLVLAEDRAWSRVSGPEKYGIIATYFPRVRLARAHVVVHGRFHALSLEMHASHGGETVEILIPSLVETAVREAIQAS